MTGRICEGVVDLTMQVGIVRIGKGRGINGLLQTDQTFEGSRARLGEQGLAQCCVQVCFRRPRKECPRKECPRKETVSTTKLFFNNNYNIRLLKEANTPVPCWCHCRTDTIILETRSCFHNATLSCSMFESTIAEYNR